MGASLHQINPSILHERGQRSDIALHAVLRIHPWIPPRPAHDDSGMPAAGGRRPNTLPPAGAPPSARPRAPLKAALSFRAGTIPARKLRCASSSLRFLADPPGDSPPGDSPRPAAGPAGGTVPAPPAKASALSWPLEKCPLTGDSSAALVLSLEPFTRACLAQARACAAGRPEGPSAAKGASVQRQGAGGARGGARRSQAAQVQSPRGMPASGGERQGRCLLGREGVSVQ